MIEISRYIPFGQYVNNGSPLAKMDPRTKMGCAILLIVLVSFLHSYIAFAIFLLFCLLLQRVTHITLTYVVRSLRPFMIFLCIAFILEVIFYPTPSHTPVLWHWWFLNISWTGIWNSLLSIVRVLFLYYLVMIFTLTTSLVDLTDGMEALLSPLQKIGIATNPFVMVFVIAFKFVPIFVTEVERLMKAQTARGVRFGQGNLFQRVYKLGLLIIPLFVSGFKRVQTLSTAMEARCYGGPTSRKRTRRRVLQFQRFDAIALSLTILLCIVTTLINVFI
jgi:energy-coupling factor transport system permease protein